MRWVVHVANRQDEKLIQNLVGNPEGKKPLWKTGRRWKDNIKNILKHLKNRNVVVERLTLLLRIREVTATSLGPETGCPD
jgi:hypothetical protein